jgi:hypothetical protein
MTPAPNVAEKNRTKGEARLRFFVARAAEGGEAYTVLLGEVENCYNSNIILKYA